MFQSIRGTISKKCLSIALLLHRNRIQIGKLHMKTHLITIYYIFFSVSIFAISSNSIIIKNASSSIIALQITKDHKITRPGNWQSDDQGWGTLTKNESLKLTTNGCEKIMLTINYCKSKSKCKVKRDDKITWVVRGNFTHQAMIEFPLIDQDISLVWKNNKLTPKKGLKKKDIIVDHSPLKS